MNNPEFIRQLRTLIESAAQGARGERENDERRRIMSTVGQDIAKMIAPALAEIASSAKVNKEEMRAVAQELAASVNARELPGIDTGAIVEAIYEAFGQMKVEPKITVTTPPMKIPDLRWPEGDMPIKGWVRLMGVDMEHPLPVQLRDASGNPIKLFENLTQIVQGTGSGGGKHDFFTIKGFSQSAYSEFMNADGRLRVSVETGGSGLTDSELRAAHLDVQQVSGAVDSVYVTGASGTLAANIVDSTGVAYSGSNPLPVVFGASATSAVNIVDSTGEAYSGSNPVPISGTVAVSDITASVKSALIDSTGVQYSGSNPLPITGTVVASSITASVAAALVDSGGVAYSGSNPVPISDAGGSVTIDGSVSVTGSIASTVVTGPVVSDGADDGSAPVKTGGIARQANPSAVAAGDTVSFSADDLGRQVTRPVQVRDLIATAYVEVTTGTEATLLASGTGAFLDLVEVMCANNSDAATYIQLRASTGGTICKTIQVPANGTAGVSLSVPYPAPFADHTWTVDMPDITGTTISITALFSKEV